MINYIRHDEQFYDTVRVQRQSTFKLLLSGSEIHY